MIKYQHNAEKTRVNNFFIPIYPCFSKYTSQNPSVFLGFFSNKQLLRPFISVCAFLAFNPHKISDNIDIIFSVLLQIRD
jgi:hypothetical protein